MAYATNADVAAYLGRTLTSPQQVQCDLYISAASAWIDQYTGRTWNPSSPAVELHSIFGPILRTNIHPITAVTSVTIRDIEPGSDLVVLEDGEGYELLDAVQGIISLGIVIVLGGPSFIYPRYNGYYATVTYTHPYACPDNIKLAVILMAASKMNASLNPIQQRVRSFSDNRAISITFRDEEISKEIYSLLPPKQLFIV